MFLLWFILPLTVLAQILPPTLPRDSQLIKKTTLTISYNPRHKQADWVFYPLGKKELKNCVPRGKGFKEDPETPDGAKLEDYKGSGYQRGHLSPAADNKWSRQVMGETFFLTNISPQKMRFNTGIWANLERLIRAWASKNDSYVVTGPILNENLRTIGRGVSVPETFYKVILTEDKKEAIGIQMSTDASGNLNQYATTVNEVEHATGLNFFPGIPEEIESVVHKDFWDFDAKYNPLPCN